MTRLAYFLLYFYIAYSPLQAKLTDTRLFVLIVLANDSYNVQKAPMMIQQGIGNEDLRLFSSLSFFPQHKPQTDNGGSFRKSTFFVSTQCEHRYYTVNGKGRR